MTRAEINSQMLDELSRPGAPKQQKFLLSIHVINENIAQLLKGAAGSGSSNYKEGKKKKIKQLVNHFLMSAIIRLMQSLSISPTEVKLQCWLVSEVRGT